jgi:ABC-2 type transport system ATP-binding protein
MKQKLAIARALIHEPQVLFMDEPTANLDPEAAKTVREFILQLKKEKKTIFLNTHNLDEAQRICDRVAIMNTSLRAIGTPQELERSVSGKKTVIGLEQQINDAVLAALKKLPLKNPSTSGDTITFDVENPDKENSPVIEAVVLAGGHVRSINVVGSTLEDTYLKLVRKQI